MPTNAAGLVYGTILVATLLSAESPRQENYLDTALAVLIALCAYWLTISYAELAGERFDRSEPLTIRALVRVAIHELSLLLGAIVPLLVLLVFWVAGAELATGVSVAVWFAAGTVGVAEVVIAVRADLRGRELIGQALLGAALGLFIIVIRLLLH